MHRSTATGGMITTTSASSERVASSNHALLRAGLITLGAAYLATIVGGQIAQGMFDNVARSVGGTTAVNYLAVPFFGAWGGLIYNENTVRPNCEQYPPALGHRDTSNGKQAICVALDRGRSARADGGRRADRRGTASRASRRIDADGAAAAADSARWWDRARSWLLICARGRLILGRRSGKGMGRGDPRT